jgi:tol-pal system protein YbgF
VPVPSKPTGPGALFRAAAADGPAGRVPGAGNAADNGTKAMNPYLRARATVALLTAPLLLGGCVGAFFRQPVNVEVTREEVDAMRKEQAELLALVRDLKTQMDSQTEATAAMRADTNAQLRDLEQKLEVLRAQLEDQGVRFEKFQRRVQESPAPPPATPSATFPDTALGSPAETTGVGMGERPPASATELYDAAYRDWSRGNYQLAVAGFEDLLRYYPESDRADNAQFYIGESYFALGDLDRAIQEYLKVRDLYPDGNKRPAATLKLGYAFLRKGDSATARKYFETVMREYPDSPEARLAKDKLDSLR